MAGNGPVQELDYYLYKVTTRKGEFWADVTARGEEAAELAIWKLFIEFNLPYQRLELRKNLKGEKEQRINIDENGTIMAGELIWRAIGRIAEFEAADIALNAGFAAEREEYEQRRGN